MENEQMNQQPTYDQLAQAYTAILRENEQLKAALNSIQGDKTIERIKLLVDIIKTFAELPEDKSCDKIIKNAKWHLEQMLEKPKTK